MQTSINLDFKIECSYSKFQQVIFDKIKLEYSKIQAVCSDEIVS